MTSSRLPGLVLIVLAVLTAFALGTVGWLAVGLGVMTDCTTNYSCSSGTCAPCRETSLWVNAGGLLQWGLVVAGVVLGVVGWRARRGGLLAGVGGALLVASIATFAATSTLADGSYCRPGSEGYEESYCDVD